MSDVGDNTSLGFREYRHPHFTIGIDNEGFEDGDYGDITYDSPPKRLGNTSLSTSNGNSRQRKEGAVGHTVVITDPHGNNLNFYDIDEDDQYNTQTPSMFGADSDGPPAYSPVMSKQQQHCNWKNAWLNYLHSEKGRELSMGTSYFYAIAMIIISIVILISVNLHVPRIRQTMGVEFFIFMYGVSIIILVYFIIMGHFGHLSTDDSIRKGKQRAPTFLRAGTLILGSGGLVQHAIELAMFALTPSEACEPPLVDVFEQILALLFIPCQVIFVLKYQQVRINRHLTLALLSRLLIMQVIATNLCVWLKIIILHSTADIQNNIHSRIQSDPIPKVTTQFYDNTTTTECRVTTNDLDDIIIPYTVPFLVAFVVVSSVMLLGMWERCGVGYKCPPPDLSDPSILEKTFKEFTPPEPDEQVSLLASEEPSSTEPPSSVLDRTNSFGVGFIAGWLVVLTCFVVVLIVLYELYSRSGLIEFVESASYATNTGLAILGIIVIPITMRQMSVLTFKDEEIRKIRGKMQKDDQPSRHHGVRRTLDKNLLGGLFLALMAFKILSCISAYEQSDIVVFVDGILCIIMGNLQGVFINGYAFQKRSTTEKHRHTKPGCQGLEFLRCMSIASWLINTFLIQSPEANMIQKDTFGVIPWSILSNILLPLVILYYFHAAVCYAEIIHQSYTTKYIGLVRPRKMNKKNRSNTIKSSRSLLTLTKTDSFNGKSLNMERDGKVVMKSNKTELSENESGGTDKITKCDSLSSDLDSNTLDVSNLDDNSQL